MIIEKFLKKDYIDKDNETCDKVLKLIDEYLLKDIKHRIEYEYFEDVNNAIVKIDLVDYISNFDAPTLSPPTKNNFSKFNGFTNFFIDKCDFVMIPYSNHTIRIELIFWNNIQKVLKELEIIQASKKYNL